MYIPRRLVRLLTASLTAAAVAGCASSHTAATSSAGPASPTSASSSPRAAASPSSTVSAAQAGEQLMAHLLPVPADARPWHSNGVLDMDGLLNALFLPEVRTEEKAKLTRRGFLAAARHAWIGADGTQADIVLIRFSVPTGPQSMVSGMVSGWKDKPDSGSPFTDTADQASGLTDGKLDDMGNAVVKLIAAHGDTIVFIHYFSTATPDQQGAQDLMHHQLAALDGSGTPAVAPGA